MKTATRPMEPVEVITSTWRVSEPCVKTAGARGGDTAGSDMVGFLGEGGKAIA
jgi:hypothetical protein